MVRELVSLKRRGSSMRRFRALKTQQASDGWVVALGNKSSEPRLNLSGSWQQGHSAAYSTPFLIRVVCRGSIGSGP